MPRRLVYLPDHDLEGISTQIRRELARDLSERRNLRAEGFAVGIARQRGTGHPTVNRSSGSRRYSRRGEDQGTTGGDR